MNSLKGIFCVALRKTKYLANGWSLSHAPKELVENLDHPALGPRPQLSDCPPPGREALCPPCRPWPGGAAPQPSSTWGWPTRRARWGWPGTRGWPASTTGRLQSRGTRRLCTTWPCVCYRYYTGTVYTCPFLKDKISQISLARTYFEQNAKKNLTFL